MKVFRNCNLTQGALIACFQFLFYFESLVCSHILSNVFTNSVDSSVCFTSALLCVFELPSPARSTVVKRFSSSIHREGFYFSIQFPVFLCFCVLTTPNCCEPLPGMSCCLPLIIGPIKQLLVAPLSFVFAFRVLLLCDLVSPWSHQAVPGEESAMTCQGFV